MIIHRYQDGSEGFEYTIGDRVLVENTIPGGWFNFGPTHAECCTVENIKGESRHTCIYEIRYSPEWGTASCYPWMLRPHPETLATATVQIASRGEN